MIEDGLFLILGFCAATLLALACLPLLWARALRLTRQRLELLVPWSKEEIDAERDGWRAQAAVTQRRLEQDAEESRARLARRDVELGHRTASLSRVEAARDELEAVRRGLLAELAAQGRDLRDSEAQRGALEKALHDADRRIETDGIEAREQSRRYDRLSELAEERRGTIAALETRVAGLQAKVEDRDDALAKLTTSMNDVMALKTSLAAELEATGRALAGMTKQHEEAARALAEERGRAVERDERLRHRTEALAAAEARMAEQDDALRTRAADLAALQRRFDALQRSLEARQGDDLAGDTALRQAIADVGDDALRLLAPDTTTHEPARPIGADLVKAQP